MAVERRHVDPITSGSDDPGSPVYPKSVTMRIVSSNFSAGVSSNVETNNARLGSTPVRYGLATESPVTVSSSGAVTSGAIRVSGAHSSLLLLVTATDTFSLQVDTNGDGTADSTRAVTLADLQALN